MSDAKMEIRPSMRVKTGVNRASKPASVPGMDISTLFSAFELRMPWLKAYRERYCAQRSAREYPEPIGLKPMTASGQTSVQVHLCPLAASVSISLNHGYATVLA